MIRHGLYAFTAMWAGLSAFPATAADMSPIPAKAACDALSGALPAGAKIGSAVVNARTDTSPEHCEIKGEINSRTSPVTKQTYAIKFHLRLPASWNGRFLFIAQGGNDGNLGDAMGGVPGKASALAQGFAVVSTDTGHDNGVNSVKGDGEQANFGLDPQARLDYGYNADDVVTQTAKRLIAAYYGQGARTSYMMGCSNGGRHGMVDAVRFPDYFDGILVGDPGFNLPQAAVAEAWDNQAFAAIATAKDDTGAPALWTAFTDADLALVSNEVRNRCDALDGAADGMVNDIRGCQSKVDISKLQCTGAKTATCLTSAQVAALRKVMSGAKDSKGKALYADWPWDAGLGAPGWRSWKLGTGAGNPRSGFPANRNDASNATLAATSLPYVFITPPVAGPNYFDYTLKFDFDKDAPKIFAKSGAYGASSMEFMAATTEIAPFIKSNGKMIIYHGVSDPVFSFNDTVNWYDAVAGKNGGVEAVRGAIRLFAVPGMNHCGGGPATSQFDGLAALVDWVESGKAPDSIMATAPANVSAPVPAGRTRPLCAYPQQAHYNGSGSIEDAANFSCR